MQSRNTQKELKHAPQLTLPLAALPEPFAAMVLYAAILEIPLRIYGGAVRNFVATGQAPGSGRHDIDAYFVQTADKLPNFCHFIQNFYTQYQQQIKPKPSKVEFFSPPSQDNFIRVWVGDLQLDWNRKNQQYTADSDAKHVQEHTVVTQNGLRAKLDLAHWCNEEDIVKLKQNIIATDGRIQFKELIRAVTDFSRQNVSLDIIDPSHKALAAINNNQLEFMVPTQLPSPKVMLGLMRGIRLGWAWGATLTQESKQFVAKVLLGDPKITFDKFSTVQQRHLCSEIRRWCAARPDGLLWLFNEGGLGKVFEAVGGAKREALRQTLTTLAPRLQAFLSSSTPQAQSHKINQLVAVLRDPKPDLLGNLAIFAKTLPDNIAYAQPSQRYSYWPIMHIPLCEYQQMQRQVATSTTEVFMAQQVANNAINAIASKQTEIKRLQEHTKELQQTLIASKSELAKLKDKHQADTAEITQAHKQALQDLELKHAQAIIANNAAHAEALNEQAAKLTAQKNTITQQALELKQLRADNARLQQAAGEQQRTYDKLVTEHAATLAARDAAHAEALSAEAKQHTLALDGAKAAFERKVDEARKLVDTYKRRATDLQAKKAQQDKLIIKLGRDLYLATTTAVPATATRASAKVRATKLEAGNKQLHGQVKQLKIELAEAKIALKTRQQKTNPHPPKVAYRRTITDKLIHQCNALLELARQVGQFLNTREGWAIYQGVVLMLGYLSYENGWSERLYAWMVPSAAPEDVEFKQAATQACWQDVACRQMLTCFQQAGHMRDCSQGMGADAPPAGHSPSL